MSIRFPRLSHAHRNCQIDRRAVDDSRNLIVLVIVIEDIAIERQRAVEQRVLRAQFKRIDEFRLEGQRMDRIGDIAAC